MKNKTKQNKTKQKKKQKNKQTVGGAGRGRLRSEADTGSSRVVAARRRDVAAAPVRESRERASIDVIALRPDRAFPSDEATLEKRRRIDAINPLTEKSAREREREREPCRLGGSKRRWRRRAWGV